MGLVAKRIEHVPHCDPPKVVIKSRNPEYASYERIAEEIRVVGWPSGSHGGCEVISTLQVSGAKYVNPADEDLIPMGRPRQYKQTARLSVSFEKTDYDRVTALAEAHDVSTAWIIRKAVRNYLDDHGHSAGPIRSYHGTEGIVPDLMEDGPTR